MRTYFALVRPLIYIYIRLSRIILNWVSSDIKWCGHILQDLKVAQSMKQTNMAHGHIDKID